MVNIVIDGKNIVANDNQTILQIARENEIDIPTLCYLKDVNEIGACRVCLVEIEGEEKLFSACNTIATDKMVISTNSQRVQKARKTNVELILSQHNYDCDNCVRNNTCVLQKLVRDLGVDEEKYKDRIDKNTWDLNLPLIRDNSKCIKCFRCVSECEVVQNMNVWEITGTGSRTKVSVREGIDFNDVNCALCGQCVTHCPVGALSARDDISKVKAALDDKDKITVFQIAPAVRSVFSDMFDLSFDLSSEKLMAASVKALGADYVFDTNFAADLTIMEEGSELIEHLKTRQDTMPMFTSCCPGWIRFIKSEFPDMVKYLSSSKSPQQMFGAVTKSYFAKKLGVSPDKIVCISIMPCLAKKYECDVKEVNDASCKDVDIVLTTRELGRLLNEKGIDVKNLNEVEFDSPLGVSTGAAVIFGATGGVMEAALRSAYYLIKKKNPPLDVFKYIRAMSMDKAGKYTWREASFSIDDLKLKVAVASGLGNTRALLNAIKNKEVQYDFVEIMACPGGCAGGGGQPIIEGEELAYLRGQRLYNLDENNKIRFSHENPEVLTLYKEYLEKPLSSEAERLLHTNQEKWEL